MFLYIYLHHGPRELQSVLSAVLDFDCYSGLSLRPEHILRLVAIISFTFSLMILHAQGFTLRWRGYEMIEEAG